MKHIDYRERKRDAYGIMHFRIVNNVDRRRSLAAVRGTRWGFK